VLFCSNPCNFIDPLKIGGDFIFINALATNKIVLGELNVEKEHMAEINGEIIAIQKKNEIIRIQEINNMTSLTPQPPDSQLLLYHTEDGHTRIEVQLKGETVWLSLNQMATLFQRDKSVISKHIRNVFDEGELSPDSTVAKFATVQTEGNRSVSREIEFYNLDVIISIGYRVKSHRGTQFRIWATQQLKEYIIKGFALDDQRLKNAGGGNYFKELLARIRDIRTSEKVFWRQVLDIYATSIDYDPSEEITKRFFSTVQNKMHWAAHGKTAAEIIAERADASLPYMGLTSWAGEKPRKNDVAIAKNYLKQEELDALNKIVTAYLDFAEVQALNQHPLYMIDWIAKLDDFLKLSERQILKHAGKISHGTAIQRAETEYLKYQETQSSQLSQVEKDFLIEAKKIEKIKQLPAAKDQKKNI
jgi:hypothetical protein